MGISISDLHSERPGDATLQNLLSVLSAKLELCSRLPILEYEAAHEGHEQSAAAFRRLAEIERRSFNDLLDTLHRHLDAAAESAAARASVPGGHR